jgi:hypothetical protein
MILHLAQLHASPGRTELCNLGLPVLNLHTSRKHWTIRRRCAAVPGKSSWEGRPERRRWAAVPGTSSWEGRSMQAR